MIARRKAGGMMTNWPEASAVASAMVLPPSRSSTFSFGAARPAMTASPEGSTFTMSNAGFKGKAFSTDAGALAGGGVAATGAGAGGTIEGLASVGSLATARSAGLGSRKSGWVHTTAPAPAATTAKAAAPTQISVFRDGMLTHSRPQHIAQSEQLRQISDNKPSFEMG